MLECCIREANPYGATFGKEWKSGYRDSNIRILRAWKTDTNILEDVLQEESNELVQKFWEEKTLDWARSSKALSVGVWNRVQTHPPQGYKCQKLVGADAERWTPRRVKLARDIGDLKFAEELGRSD
jgi:hypothetical protein